MANLDLAEARRIVLARYPRAIVDDAFPPKVGGCLIRVGNFGLHLSDWHSTETAAWREAAKRLSRPQGPARVSGR